MNKQEIENKIEALEKQIEELKKEVNSPEFEGIKKGVRQKPKKDENYFFLGDDGGIYPETYLGDRIDLFHFNIGNCFKTEQEAEEYKENLLTKQQLKDLALELNNGVEIDWSDDNQLKFYIYSGRFQQDLDQDNNIGCPDVGQVYCIDESFLDVAKERIGEEKLIKLIKSGI